MSNLENTVVKTRARLTEYRVKKSTDYVSIHINALEIALSLVEFSLNTSPSRAILKEEEQWFKAGFDIDQILANSEWEDMIDLYYEIVEGVEKRNFFR